jgi:predicted SAM-dependent methyltransferase
MPPELPYLNLGCGYHYHPEWVNVDFVSTGPNVKGHDLLTGIPFPDNSFEVVYHSHVLEHFPKHKAAQFISECYRVLKPGGIIRIAVPDLEQITSNYNRLLKLGKANPDDEKIRADYDWMIIEMYDQTVRSAGGGEMIKYLAKETIANEDFIYQRIGHEGIMLRKGIIDSFNNPPAKVSLAKKIYRKIRWNIHPRNYKNLFLQSFFPKEYRLIELSRFRQSGEIHQWMYDVYSLGNLLKDAGFKNIQQKDFDESNIPDWRSSGLDEVNNVIRKPDSLFTEAVK